MGSETPIWVQHENGEMQPDHLCYQKNATRWVKLEDLESQLAERDREKEIILSAIRKARPFLGDAMDVLDKILTDARKGGRDDGQ